jgi:hypothetical protein
MMTATTPEWLSRHGGELTPRTGFATWDSGPTFAVLFDGGPQYLLAVVPVAGKFGCRITQTINGKLLGSGASHATAEQALQAGLEELRQALGW